MRIIISPAKKMNVDNDGLSAEALPVFLEDTKVLCQGIRQMSLPEVQALWKCNDKLAALNFERFAHMDLEKNLTPAVFSYEGLQYQHMAPAVFTEEQLAYIQEHLRILSGFYGILRPFDGVVPYRLEMQAAYGGGRAANLYGFWGDRLCRELYRENPDNIVINLASKEYSKAVEPHCQPGQKMITVEFCQMVDGKRKQKGTLAKMARGEMVRYMAENQVQKPEELRDFHALGFSYMEEVSTQKTMVFCVQDDKTQKEDQWY